ncbi:MAG: 2-keto-3-deoxygluconate permease, partial [Mycobacterium sp.]
TVVPSIVAEANPVYAPAAESATVLVAASVVVSAILCPIITVLWARVVLKQPAGGSRESDAAFAEDPPISQGPDPNGRGDELAGGSRGKDAAFAEDRPTSQQPDRNGRGDESKGKADA